MKSESFSAKAARVAAATIIALGIATSSLSSVHAAVVVTGTRVIYNAPDRETTIKLSNKGKQPALTQAWIDNGDSSSSPTNADVPFTITPPVARIDPDKSQTLRIFYTGEALPQDRESVYWLNVLEVPPEPQAGQSASNYLQIAFSSRIKLFFRPANLKGNAAEAPSHLGWRLVRDGSTTSLEVSNPTPYYVSFASIDVNAQGKHGEFKSGGMVAPLKTEHFELNGELAPSVSGTVHYRAINDNGGLIEGDAPLGGASSSAP